MEIKILDIYKYDEINNRLGYRIALKNIISDKFKKIIKLIKNLGLKRDFREEIKLKKFSDKIIYEGKALKNENIEQNYKKSGAKASLLFNEKSKFLSLHWKGNHINGEEITSILLSNLN